MSKMKALKERADQYAGEHRKAFEAWPYGEVEDAYIDDDGVFCIRYEKDSKWFHYEETPEGLKWW